MTIEIVTRRDSERRWFDAGDAGVPATIEAYPLPGTATESHVSSMPRSWLARMARPEASIEAFRQKGLSVWSQAVTLEIERGTPFLLIPVLLGLGAFVYFSWPDEPSFAILVAVLAGLGTAALVLRAGSASRALLLALFLVMLGAVVAKTETWRLGTKMLGGEISTRLTGRVVHLDTTATGRVRLTMDVLKTERPVLKYVPDRVRVTARKSADQVSVGSIVSGLVKLRPPSGPVRPGSYDFSFDSYFDGIGASGFFMTGPEMVGRADAGFGQSVADRIEASRDRIASRIRGQVGGPEGEIAAALLVGVRAGIPDDVSEALRRTGIYHIISISGLHMALVAGAVIGTVRILFALFPDFASRRPIRKYAAVAGLLAIGGYLVISGGEVAAQRSFLMLAVMLVALLFDRAALTMRNLAISAIIVLVVSPHEAIGPSFQMSYAATAALVGAYSFWSERRARTLASSPEPPKTLLGLGLRKVAGGVTGLLITSLVAGLATTASGAYHFQRVSPLSLPANLAVMPIVSCIITPSAVLAAVAMPFGLDGPFLFVMGKGIGAMVAVAEWISARSPIDAVGLISGYSVILLTIALVIATVATTRLRLVALPFAVAGCLMLGAVRQPDLLVAEDAALVGFASPEGALVINRPRGGGFTTDAWMRALAANRVSRSTRDTADGDRAPNGFSCSDTKCVARHPTGALIVQTADEEEARQACGSASVIVIEDAASRLHCANRDVLLVTRRQLARSGSAAIYLPAPGSRQRAEVEFSIDGQDRPWHRQRVYSREARGLPTFRRGAKGN